MKNTRNRVRLTESQLHQVIKESVRQVLSELDWKTYQSAYEKQHARGYEKNHPMRVRDKAFKKAARKAFNDQFGYEGENGYYKAKGDGESPKRYYQSYMKTYPFTAMDFHTQARISKPKHTDYYDDVIDYGFNEPRYKNGYNGKPYGYYNLNHRNIDDYYDKMGEIGRKAQKGNKEIENFRNGNYTYEPNGRGWHLKDNMDESIRRAIRNTLK